MWIATIYLENIFAIITALKNFKAIDYLQFLKFE